MGVRVENIKELHSWKGCERYFEMRCVGSLDEMVGVVIVVAIAVVRDCSSVVPVVFFLLLPYQSSHIFLKTRVNTMYFEHMREYHSRSAVAGFFPSRIKISG
jgi:hypothetical protein